MLTVEDVINMPPEDIMKHIVVQKEIAPEDTSKRKEVLLEIKKKLFGFFFKEPELIAKGQVVHIKEDSFVQITSVIESSGRVFFRINGEVKQFSVPKEFLLGKNNNEQLDFKKGEIVKFEDCLWTIKGLNPASNRIILNKIPDGTKMIVAPQKVEKVSSLNV